jgi:hypothetical protein
MTTTQYRIVVGVLTALATLITAETAYAAGYARRYQTASTAYNVHANPNYGFGPRVSVHPNDVISDERIIGRDPDPFIRGQILRAYDSGYPDSLGFGDISVPGSDRMDNLLKVHN